MWESEGDRRDQEQFGFDTSWSPGRFRIEQLLLSSERLELIAIARNPEDVAEVICRLEAPGPAMGNTTFESVTSPVGPLSKTTIPAPPGFGWTPFSNRNPEQGTWGRT